MELRNFYKDLQVDPIAEPEVIAAAYKRLAAKYHPDLNKTPDATVRMQLINLAYEILGDPAKRASYDRERELQNSTPPVVRKTNEPQPAREEPNHRDEFLAYQSDFNVASDEWAETESVDHRSFRKAGYLHIRIHKSPWEWHQYPIIPVTDFRVSVDSQFAKNSGATSECGIVFRLSPTSSGDDFYRFSITKSGAYSLFLHIGNSYESIVDYRFSEYIKLDHGVNSFLLRMTGQEIKLGINGHILATVEDRGLESGSVGLLVCTHDNDGFAEARFRNFRLYMPWAATDSDTTEYGE